MPQAVTLSISQPVLAKAMRDALTRHGVIIAGDAAILLTDSRDDAAAQTVITIGADPWRVGAILDRIDRAGRAEPAVIAFGPYILATTDLLLTRKDRAPVRLTEKERDLLVRLHNAVGAMERDDLLSEIWGYADGVETHTLETHVYRLRQKLEDDPASPQWLLTEGSGYRLGGRL